MLIGGALQWSVYVLENLVYLLSYFRKDFGDDGALSCIIEISLTNDLLTL